MLLLDTCSSLTKGTPPYPHPRWKKTATTVAGGNGKGARNDQLGSSFDFCVDEDQTVYIADYDNHRIMAWKIGSITGELVAGGNGAGYQPYQLNSPTSVIIDQSTGSLVICDRGNGRIVRWPLQRFADPSIRSPNEGQVIISNIDCSLLAMDDAGSLYLSDLTKNEIRRYERGDRRGTVIAGGFLKGDQLDRFNGPTHLFIDSQSNLYVSDTQNHRVMKWLNGSVTGVVVAGGNGGGMELSQLSDPEGIWVNGYGDVYVVDSLNDRIMRWNRGAKVGTLIIGEQGSGSNSNQLNAPRALFFDRDGDLYVGDYQNFRVQRFSIK